MAGLGFRIPQIRTLQSSAKTAVGNSPVTVMTPEAQLQVTETRAVQRKGPLARTYCWGKVMAMTAPAGICWVLPTLLLKVTPSDWNSLDTANSQLVSVFMARLPGLIDMVTSKASPTHNRESTPANIQISYLLRSVLSLLAIQMDQKLQLPHLLLAVVLKAATGPALLELKAKHCSFRGFIKLMMFAFLKPTSLQHSALRRLKHYAAAGQSVSVSDILQVESSHSAIINPQTRQLKSPVKELQDMSCQFNESPIKQQPSISVERLEGWRAFALKLNFSQQKNRLSAFCQIRLFSTSLKYGKQCAAYNNKNNELKVNLLHSRASKIVSARLTLPFYLISYLPADPASTTVQLPVQIQTVIKEQSSPIPEAKAAVFKKGMLFPGFQITDDQNSIKVFKLQLNKMVKILNKKVCLVLFDVLCTVEYTSKVRHRQAKPKRKDKIYSIPELAEQEQLSQSKEGLLGEEEGHFNRNSLLEEINREIEEFTQHLSSTSGKKSAQKRDYSLAQKGSLRQFEIEPKSKFDQIQSLLELASSERRAPEKESRHKFQTQNKKPSREVSEILKQLQQRESAYFESKKYVPSPGLPRRDQFTFRFEPLYKLDEQEQFGRPKRKEDSVMTNIRSRVNRLEEERREFHQYRLR